jgi:hypothetical protein
MSTVISPRRVIQPADSGNLAEQILATASGQLAAYWKGDSYSGGKVRDEVAQAFNTNISGSGLETGVAGHAGPAWDCNGTASYYTGAAIPAAANAVAQFGPAFNVGKFISITGKALGLRELDELWNEPVFQMQMMEQLARAPQMADSKAMPASDGARPGQPNPMAWYRSQIVDERNQERQQVAAGAQSTYDRVRQTM